MKPGLQEKTNKATGHSTQRHWRGMNRKQRRETMRKIRQRRVIKLEVVHPDAASIVYRQRIPLCSCTAGAGTANRYGASGVPALPPELKAMADWLKQCGIRTVAMQSTGVYWIAVFDILEQAGLEVYLVNARETKNLLVAKQRRARESTADEAAHIRAVAKFVSPIAGELRRMRTYWRQRR